jgi:hypothetical protein
MKRVLMMIGVTHLVVVEIEPRDEAQDAKKKPIEPFRFEHCAVGKLVGGKTCNERIDRAVGKDRQGKTDPDSAIEKVVGRRSGDKKENNVTGGLQDSLQVASPRKNLELDLIDWAPIP